MPVESGVERACLVVIARIGGHGDRRRASSSGFESTNSPEQLVPVFGEDPNPQIDVDQIRGVQSAVD
jgi:hypothetical protein